jgi:hypothetical protein
VETGIRETPELSETALNAQKQQVGTTVKSERDLHETTYARFQISVVVAADEEFQQVSYWTPWNLNGLAWKDAATNIIERGDNYLFDTYSANVIVEGFLTWQSDNTVTDRELMLKEMVDQLHWTKGAMGGAVLVGFTGQPMMNGNVSIAGVAFYPYENETRAMLLRATSYWKDDNEFQHELSHILGLDDHISMFDENYPPECVMSYKKVYVSTWTEDNWVWLINDYVLQVYVTHKYDSECERQLLTGKFGLKNYEAVIEHPLWVGGGKVFPK